MRSSDRARPSLSTVARVVAATVAAAADNILTITGHTAGDGGLGTSVRLVNMTGATNGWAVEAITYGQGANSEAGTIAFT